MSTKQLRATFRGDAGHLSRMLTDDDTSALTAQFEAGTRRLPKFVIVGPAQTVMFAVGSIAAQGEDCLESVESVHQGV